MVWSSSNPSVASVSGKGVVIAKKTGKATITGKIGKKKYTCKITVKGDWRKLYKAKLSSAKNTPWYYVKDINKDALPELITVGEPGGYNVFTVKNGKVVLAGSWPIRGMVSMPSFVFVPKYNGLYVTGWINGIAATWEKLYVLSGSKLVEKYYARESHNPSAQYYTGTTDRNYKNVSKSSYTAFRKKYFKTGKTFYLIDNTEENREKSFG